jgi:hypothetical protein
MRLVLPLFKLLWLMLMLSRSLTTSLACSDASVEVVDVVVVVHGRVRTWTHRPTMSVWYMLYLDRNALSGVLDTRQVSVSRLSNVLKLDR